jgi:hypothetical protein
VPVGQTAGELVRDRPGLGHAPAPDRDLGAGERESRPPQGLRAADRQPAGERLDAAGVEERGRRVGGHVRGRIEPPGLRGELERLLEPPLAARLVERVPAKVCRTVAVLALELSQEEVAEQRVEAEASLGGLVQEPFLLEPLEPVPSRSRPQHLGRVRVADRPRNRGAKHQLLQLRRLAPEDLLGEVAKERAGDLALRQLERRREPGEADHGRPALRPLDQGAHGLFGVTRERPARLLVRHRELVPRDLGDLAVEDLARGGPAGPAPARGEEPYR